MEPAEESPEPPPSPAPPRADSPPSPPDTRPDDNRPGPATIATGQAAAISAAETSAPPDTLAGQTVYVIDAHSLIYQVFHALPEMTSPSGAPVGAVFGFVRDLLFLLESKRPDYLFCAFDLPGKTFRHELFDQYKADRPPMPDDLALQIATIREVLQVMGVPAVGVESFEADDVLAAMARATDRLGGRCLLVTGDKDSRQLITDRVQVYNIRKNEVFDREQLRQAWGIRPDQVVDFQALVGDKVDNVPGVPLIGPKLARQLLEQFDTLDEVLDHADEVSGKKRKENLKNYRDQALLSRKLVRLDDQVPLEIDWHAGRVEPPDCERLLPLFAELGFNSLAARVEALGGDVTPKVPPMKVEYHLVDTPEALRELVARLRRQQRISVDTETVCPDTAVGNVWPRWAEIVGLSFAWNETEGWYLPLRGPRGQRCLETEPALDALRPVLEDPDVEKVGQNLKYEMIVLRSAGIELAGVAFDTMVASYLLDAGQRNHNLDELARRYLDHTTTKISALIGTGKEQKRMDEVPVEQVVDYAGEDAVIPLRLRPILAERLAETHLESLYRDVELPVIEVLAELESNGIQVDVARLEQLSRQYGDRIEKLQEEIHDLAGHPLNIASPKQLAKVLFEELHLPVVKKTKTGPSTDADVLEELAGQHPLPAKIIEYRQYMKLKSTYVDALPRMVHPRTGRVHASFNQGVTATGRLSSSDPNLQNIPVRTDAGREIRSAFVPGHPGWVLLAADYSQIELRVLAHFSGDEQLRDAFARGQDIHSRVAAQVYGVPLEEVTSPMRRRAKAVNFGVIYGQSAFGLAKQLGIDKAEAAKFIDSYFGGYPRIEEFLASVLADCRKNGYVRTILGRRRTIQRGQIRSDTVRQKNLVERTAINTVIQGSAADLIKLAMIAVHRRLRRETLSARMLLQIHDELVFEVPANDVETLRDLVVEEMVGVLKLDVPLVVDVKSGPNWADMIPIP